jgi:Flp pilus assembly pilin Flp
MTKEAWTNRVRWGNRSDQRGATLPEYALILAGLTIATVVGAQVLEAGADQNTDDAADAIGRMCHADIYLDCVDASFATTTTAATTTTNAGGGGPISTTSSSTTTTSTPTSSTSSSTTTTSTPTSSTSSSTTTTSTPTSPTTSSTTTTSTTTPTTTPPTTTTTVPEETSRLVIQKRPRLSGSLWRPRTRFWIYDQGGNRIAGAQIAATVTYLKPDGTVHAVLEGGCTTAGSGVRCNINLGLEVARDITTLWNVTVVSTPEWDGSNAEFTMTWEG